MKVLIIEDEYNLADAIAASLNHASYQTQICTDGAMGEELACSGLFDLVLLDIMLPNRNGFEILEEIRKFQPETKVIMLTAKGEIEDKVKGLRNGADDYMTKPFHMDELLARVDLQLKKHKNVQDDRLIFNDLELNLKNGMLTCTKTQESISLSAKEYAILEYLMQNQNQILSKEQIYNKVWGWDNAIESNNLEAYLSFLRKKLRLIESKSVIKAIRGMGYRLDTAEQ